MRALLYGFVWRVGGASSAAGPWLWSLASLASLVLRVLFKLETCSLEPVLANVDFEMERNAYRRHVSALFIRWESDRGTDLWPWVCWLQLPRLMLHELVGAVANTTCGSCQILGSGIRIQERFRGRRCPKWRRRARSPGTSLGALPRHIRKSRLRALKCS